MGFRPTLKTTVHGRKSNKRSDATSLQPSGSFFSFALRNFYVAHFREARSGIRIREVADDRPSVNYRYSGKAVSSDSRRKDASADSHGNRGIPRILPSTMLQRGEREHRSSAAASTRFRIRGTGGLWDSRRLKSEASRVDLKGEGGHTSSGLAGAQAKPIVATPAYLGQRILVTTTSTDRKTSWPLLDDARTPYLVPA